MFSEYLSAKVGEGSFAVEACCCILGNDISVSVGGGTAPHIGAVSLAVYEPLRDSATVSTVTVHTHRDDAVASYFAKEISREMKCTVTVSAGLHVDDAGRNEIELLQKNSAECTHKLIELLKSTRVEEK